MSGAMGDEGWTWYSVTAGKGGRGRPVGKEDCEGHLYQSTVKGPKPVLCGLASASFGSCSPSFLLTMSTLEGILCSLIEFRHGVLKLDASLVSITWLTAAFALPITLLAWFTVSWISSPQRKFPGLFLAGSQPCSMRQP